MAVRKKQNEKNVIYFCTITCYKWLPLFEITNFYKHIYRWFDILKTRKIFIVGYVIMPNHLHILLFVPDSCEDINGVIGTGKRFMAYEIVRILESVGRKDILYLLKRGVNEYERKKGKLHQVFRSSFDLKPIVTEKFLMQKLNYIHGNPISGKWNLAEEYWKYRHSSASFYETGVQMEYDVVHYTEIYEKTL